MYHLLIFYPDPPNASVVSAGIICYYTVIPGSCPKLFNQQLPVNALFHY